MEKGSVKEFCEDNGGLYRTKQFILHQTLKKVKMSLRKWKKEKKGIRKKNKKS